MAGIGLARVPHHSHQVVQVVHTPQVGVDTEAMPRLACYFINRLLKRRFSAAEKVSNTFST